MGEGALPSVELSHPPTLPTLDFYPDMAFETIGCHVDLFPQPLSPHLVNPPDCIMLYSPILDSTIIVHED